MRKVMLLAVLFVSLWCNSALAIEQVQMHDSYSLYDIIQKYNQYGSSVDDDVAQYMIPNSFTKWNDTFLPYTTTYYSQNHLSGIIVFACLNGQGKIVAFAVNVDKTRDKADCAIVASRLIQMMDSSNTYADVVHKCYASIATGERQMIYSNAAKRYYVATGSILESGYQCIIYAVA